MWRRSCAQITLTGGGSANPTGVALPGAYQPTDPGVSAFVVVWHWIMCADEGRFWWICGGFRLQRRTIRRRVGQFGRGRRVLGVVWCGVGIWGACWY